ncbi:MAG: ATP-dependent helicase, partial [Oscillospiraceae bacterium]|nr:ATP-dependent helicase [Oscillospiraceae bacterium]
DKEEILVQYSILELKNAYEKSRVVKVSDQDIEEALLYLAKIDSMKLEGGFLVIYSGMEINRLELDNKIKYKKDDYKQLNDFYCQKIQQIHIVGEYANMMVKDYNAALQFVNDYFQLDYKKFLNKYFEGERSKEIERNITPQKFEKLFDVLSEKQREIIDDNTSQYIVVTAGPGSGKTRVLVHKLASLLLLEDVKHEQLLMVTFSRAAVTEFKQRLYELIGNAASFVEIKTFHSYCFDLLGRMGNLDNAENIVADAAKMIKDGEVELGRITKTVVVIDEAQDMDGNEYALIEALMERNEDMRVIAVGDDDQNIYGFRGSDSKYLRSFITEKNAVKYELVENYRSCKAVVSLANAYAETITERMKVSPIISMSEAEGEVKLFRYNSRNIETAVVNDLLANFDGNSTACVLTSTNMEAMRVMGLLIKNGQRAKLIQSNDGFDIYNLAEIRYFMKMLEMKLTSPVISQEIWNETRSELESAYSRSTALPMCLSLLDDYEKSVERKYKSDLDQFIHESKLEDFYHTENGTVFVSTIHKSKGREFDSVYMLLDNVRTENDEERRKIYVGLTRAKSRLHIHYNNGIFDEFDTAGWEKISDENIYGSPDEIILQLSHKDVFLGYFKDKKDFILKLRSGMKMLVTQSGMNIVTKDGQREVLRFSRAFKGQLSDLAGRG